MSAGKIIALDSPRVNASEIRDATEEHADNFMMHLLVQNVDAWWSYVQARWLIG